jgi:hypothetical protein
METSNSMGGVPGWSVEQALTTPLNAKNPAYVTFAEGRAVGKKLSGAEVEGAMQCLREGQTADAVARLLGVSARTVGNLAKQFGIALKKGETEVMIIGICGAAGSGKSAAADFFVKNHDGIVVSLADPLKRACADWFGWDEETLWGASYKRNLPDTRYPRSFYKKSVMKDGQLVGHENDEPFAYLTPRHALQQLGTEFGRRCYQDVWVEYALRMAEQLLEGKSVMLDYVYPADYPDDAPREKYEGRAHPRYEAKRGLFDYAPRPEAAIPEFVVIPDIRFRNEVEGLKKRGAKVIRIVRPGAGLIGAAGQHLSETEQTTIPDELFDGVISNIGTLQDLETAVALQLTALREDPLLADRFRG